MLRKELMEYGRMRDISVTLLNIALIFLLLIPFNVIADMGVDSGQHILVGDEQWDDDSSDKIDGGVIADASIEEATLNAVDSPSDEECLTWEADSSQFEWQACGGAGGGDDVKVDSVDVTDPDFQDGGDINFTDTANVITATIKDDVVGVADMTHEDHGDVTWATGNAVVEDVNCTNCVDASDVAADVATQAELDAQDECNEITNCVPNAWDALTDMTLTDDYIYVGDVSNNPVGVAMSNDCTIASNGTITCDHDALDNFLANEHLDWTSDLGITNIHTGNYPITDTEVPNNITIDLSTLATTLTISDNEATAETNAVLFTSGGALIGGDLGIESDGDFHYNPSTGTATATAFVGALTGNVTGNAATSTSLAANGANCDVGEYCRGTDTSGAAENCTDATTEINSAISTHAGDNDAHHALVTLAGTPNYITLAGQQITRGTVDIGDDTNLAAGRSLTMSGDSVEVDAELYTDTKCANVDPSHTTTDWILWKAPHAITITGIDCIVDAATSVVMTLQECDANGANCVDIEAAITCATTNTTEAGGIDNASIDAGDWIRVTRGTKTGSPTQAVICWEYTKDD